MRSLRDRLNDMRTIRQLLPAAEREAQRDGQQQPAAEHLVLAALDLPDGSARRALATVGLDPDRLREAIADQHASALRAVGVTGEVADDELPAPATPRGVYRAAGSAQELFQEVARRQRAEGASMASAWFVLVAAEREHGPLPRALAVLGVDREALAEAADAELHPAAP